MPVTVGVNSLSVVHAASNGTSIAFPDTCQTPSPAGPVPIPYPNVAMSSDTASGSSQVKCDGNPICLSDSNFSMSTGDEAGSAGGGGGLAVAAAGSSMTTTSVAGLPSGVIT